MKFTIEVSFFSAESPCQNGFKKIHFKSHFAMNTEPHSNMSVNGIPPYHAVSYDVILQNEFIIFALFFQVKT